MAAFPAGLYAFTPDEADTAALVAKVRAAIAGGAAAVQYRNKRGARWRCGASKRSHSQRSAAPLACRSS